MNKKYMKTILIIIAIILAIDFFAFILWIISGQIPPDGGYYFGKITAYLLRLILI